MKKLKKLAIKKVTLQNLDEPKLEAIAGGLTGPGPTSCPQICNITKHTCIKC
jgi:natural product precursor